jgi:hypothetical protein
LASSKQTAPPLTELLEISRSGGVTGLRRKWVVFPEQIEGDQRRFLDRLWSKGEIETPRQAGADRFVYRLTLRRQDDVREVMLSEDDMPEALLRLTKRR